jgi:DNA-binding winged helix-turn-helix (wHTH) protein/tetratricopeptide (TPR) repeat protein
MNELKPLFYEFDEFSVDTERRLLLRGGQPISLTPKVFDTLIVFLENRGEVVSKDMLMHELWSDSFVEEANIAQNVAVLRRALGEKAKENKFLVTIPGRGYRFVADVKAIDRRLSQNGSSAGVKSQSTAVREFAHLVPLAEQHLASQAVALSDPESEHISSEPMTPNIVVPFPKVQRRTLFKPAIAAGVLVALLLTGLFLYRKSFPAPVSETASPRLAVLPLKPVNAETRDPGLELAIADSLILKLSETKVFQVSHLGAVRGFADVETDPIDAGRKLDVEYVLASNYQTSDGRIRVTSQLINIGTGVTEQTYKSESPTVNFFAMQDSVANEIGNAVLARFGKPATSYAATRGTENEEAVSLFYEAYYLVDKNTQEDSAKAADLLGQAVLMDPNYAQAWALRAQAYCQFAHRGGGAPNQVFTIAEPMLDKALTLDRNNSTALLVKGIINRDYHWKISEACSDLRRAIEVDPNNWFAHRELAMTYHQDGRYRDAIEEVKKAVEINPSNVASRWFLGVNLIEVGQRDEGLAQLQHVIEMDPTFLGPYDTLWQFYHREGDGPKAYSNFIKVKELFKTKPDHMARLKSAYAKGGWPATLRAELDQMQAEDHKGEYSGAKYYIAGLASLSGDRDTAFEYLEEALRFRLIGMSWIKVDHRLDPVRDDPRFAGILKRAGV